MVLSRVEILQCLDSGRVRFDPDVSRGNVEQVSIDLRLGRGFTTFKRKEDLAFLSAIRVDPSLWRADIWDRREQDSFVLDPGSIVLAQTLERVTMPDDLVGFVEGRSSWARVGVSVHITAPKIDPGFNGTITLEMANFGQLPVELRAVVDKPCQLVLMTLSSPCPAGELYGTKVSHVFQNQATPTPTDG